MEAKLIPTPPPPPPRVQITMTQEQALDLLAVTNSVGGNPTGPRRTFDALRDVITSMIHVDPFRAYINDRVDAARSGSICMADTWPDQD